MRILIYLLLPFLLATHLFAQSLSPRQIEYNLHTSYQQILHHRFDADSIAWDSLQIANNHFRTLFKDYTAHYPETLTYPFDSLRTDKIDVVTSKDNLFRIYSWDTWTGGSMHSFENIIQYKFNKQVYSKLIHDTTTVSEGDYIPFYSQIFTLSTSNRTYYLAIANGIYSTKDASQSVRIFSVENGLINDTTKLIKTKTGLTNSINVPFDFFSVVDRPERPVQLIRYNPSKKIISIPVVYENGFVTKRYIRYQFTGTYFERMK